MRKLLFVLVLFSLMIGCISSEAERAQEREKCRISEVGMKEQSVHAIHQEHQQPPLSAHMVEEPI